MTALDGLDAGSELTQENQDCQPKPRSTEEQKVEDSKGQQTSVSVPPRFQGVFHHFPLTARERSAFISAQAWPEFCLLLIEFQITQHRGHDTRRQRHVAPCGNHGLAVSKDE